MMAQKQNFKKGMFDRVTLTVRFGGAPGNEFTAAAVKVPAYKYKTYETADAGGGCYYGYKEWVERTQDNAYIILKDNEIIGWMDPYFGNIKSDLYPMDFKYTHKEIKEFAKSMAQPF